jgi:D-sedoheptulose 7-phosphate isomerase
MGDGSLFSGEFAAHREVLGDTETALSQPFAALLRACGECLMGGSKLLFFGNGGSAADAQHLATELTVRFRRNRRALAAIALTTDTSTLTAVGNDFGFEYLFSRQIEALCSSGDVAVGITTSGNSENVVRGLLKAKEIGAGTVAFTGGDGGRVKDIADIALVIPSTNTARIQEMHILIGHVLCEGIESAVVEEGGGLVPGS